MEPSVDEQLNIILTGFMGTGKTSVGRELARRTGRHFVDTDERIAERHGPIADIFRDEGESAFRRYERETAEALTATGGQVIATGGRLMLDAHNAMVLERNGRVFCLHASLDTIMARVLADGGARRRPLLSGDDPRAVLSNLHAERATGYSRFEQIETDGRTPAMIADIIIGRLDD